MADAVQVGDLVCASALPNEGVGRVEELGTPTSFGIPESLRASHRDAPVARVRWPDDTTNLMWVMDLDVLPASHAPNDVERWLHG